MYLYMYKTHSSSLAWRIPWTEESDGLQSTGSQMVGHDRNDWSWVCVCVCVCVCVGMYCCLVAKSCLTLCNPMHCSPPGFSVHGISQARILKWVAISFSRRSIPTQRLNPPFLNCQADWILYYWATWEAMDMYIYAHFYTCTHTCVYICMCVLMYACISKTYVCAYTHAHSHTFNSNLG